VPPSPYVPGLPTLACGDAAHCIYRVEYRACDGLCSCGGAFIDATCYREEGTCVDDNSHVHFTACYQGGCCCPSGNCGGGGGTGGGVGGRIGQLGSGDWCYVDSDCSGNSCNGGFCE